MKVVVRSFLAERLVLGRHGPVWLVGRDVAREQSDGEGRRTAERESVCRQHRRGRKAGTSVGSAQGSEAASGARRGDAFLAPSSERPMLELCRLSTTSSSSTTPFTTPTTRHLSSQPWTPTSSSSSTNSRTPSPTSVRALLCLAIHVRLGGELDMPQLAVVRILHLSRNTTRR